MEAVVIRENDNRYQGFSRKDLILRACSMFITFLTWKFAERDPGDLNRLYYVVIYIVYVYVYVVIV